MRNTGCIGPMLGLFAVVGLLAICAGLTGVVQGDVERELGRLGYVGAVVEPSAMAFCAKGRFGYRYSATRDGRPVSGHACAGGFLGPSLREDR